MAAAETEAGLRAWTDEHSSILPIIKTGAD